MKLSVRSILIVVIFVFLLSFPVSGYAEECDMERLKKLAEQVDVTTEFDYDGVDMGRYGDSIVTVTGLTEDIYAVTDDKADSFFYQDMKDGMIKRKLNASVKQINLYSYSCSNKKLKSFDLNLKYYNKYYDDSECDTLRDKTDFCSELVDVFYDKSIFDAKLEKYKLQNNKVDEKSSDNGMFKNVFLGILGVIVIVIVVIVSLNNIKKNRLD